MRSFSSRSASLLCRVLLFIVMTSCMSFCVHSPLLWRWRMMSIVCFVPRTLLVMNVVMDVSILT